MPEKPCEHPTLTDDILTLLFKYGANPEQTDRMGRTALHQASRSNNIKAVDFLLNNDVKHGLSHEGEFCRSFIDSQTRAKETPLMFAIDEGHIHVISLLLNQLVVPGRQGPDPFLKTISGRSILDIAKHKNKNVKAILD